MDVMIAVSCQQLKNTCKLTDWDSHSTYDEDFGGYLDEMVLWGVSRFLTQEEILSHKCKDDKNPAECDRCRKQRLPFE